ncbi:hypothetical protein BH11BAC3_BH11BAC3_23850 [soil metagenome]
MERVETLLQKLQQQVKEKLEIDQLLVTVQMLQHELLHLQGSPKKQEKNAVVVSMPVNNFAQKNNVARQSDYTDISEEKTVEVLQVNEEDIAAELEELKKNASAMQQFSGKSKQSLFFDATEEEIPTLAHQDISHTKEVNHSVESEIASLNDRLKEIKIEISEKLTDQPVKDLKKAIGINDRFLYINDLFRGDEAMYERSIKTINSFSIWAEAEYWIRRELKTKLGWSDEDETVKQFDQLVKRRFS